MPLRGIQLQSLKRSTSIPRETEEIKQGLREALEIGVLGCPVNAWAVVDRYLDDRAAVKPKVRRHEAVEAVQQG